MNLINSTNLTHTTNTAIFYSTCYVQIFIKSKINTKIIHFFVINVW